MNWWASSSSFVFQKSCWNTFSSYLVCPSDELYLSKFLFWLFLLIVWPNSSAALRDLWWNRLGQAVKDERDKEPKTTTIQITYHDAVQSIGYVSCHKKKKNFLHSFLGCCFCGLFIKMNWTVGFFFSPVRTCALSSTSNRISVLRPGVASSWQKRTARRQRTRLSQMNRVCLCVMIRLLPPFAAKLEP